MTSSSCYSIVLGHQGNSIYGDATGDNSVYLPCKALSFLRSEPDILHGMRSAPEQAGQYLAGVWLDDFSKKIYCKRSGQ